MRHHLAKPHCDLHFLLFVLGNQTEYPDVANIDQVVLNILVLLAVTTQLGMLFPATGRLRHQFIALCDRGTCVRTTCPR